MEEEGTEITNEEKNGTKNESVSDESPKKQSKSSRISEPSRSRKQSKSPRASEPSQPEQRTETLTIPESPEPELPASVPEPPVPEKKSEPSPVPEPSEKKKQSEPASTVQDKIGNDELPSEKTEVKATSTKSMLITTPLEDCENPHRVKVCVVGAGKVGMACALSILMKRIASEVCLIDKDSSMAEAEAEDIRHAAVFLGNPLVTGTSEIRDKESQKKDELFPTGLLSLCQNANCAITREAFLMVITNITMVRDSAVVIIAMGERVPGEIPNVKHNLDIFKKVIPAIAKLACNAILLIVTQPIDVMSYVAWKISKFPSNRVLGTGTLLDTMRFQYYLSKRLGLANSSINCVCIGAQGDNSVPAWSSVNVGGVKLNEINPRIGGPEDPEKWHEIADSIHGCEERLDLMKGEKGPSCWALGVCTAEIVDAIVRNTRIILPASTYIHSCSHGTDKDVYMSVPCVLGREGVHHKVRQRLTDQEKSSLQACADSIRNALRDSGILRDTSENLQD